jgi:hypothetical protein
VGDLFSANSDDLLSYLYLPLVLDPGVCGVLLLLLLLLFDKIEPVATDVVIGCCGVKIGGIGGGGNCGRIKC